MTLRTLPKKINDVKGQGAGADQELAKLPMVVQVLLDQMQPKTADRAEIRGRLANYLRDFTQKDVPASAVAALNTKLASYGLAPVSAPPSANVAAFRLLVERERSVNSMRSLHTGRDEPIDPSRLAARHRAIDAVVAQVSALGASLTNEELSDAARILELAVRFRS
jgi:hypothetical protein